MKRKGFIKRGISLLLAFTLVFGSTVTVFADDKPEPVTDVQWQNNEEMNNGAIKADMDSAEEAATAAEEAATAAEEAANTIAPLVKDAEEAVFDGTTTVDKEDKDGNPIYQPQLGTDGEPVYEVEKDASGLPVLDSDGNPIMTPVFEVETDAEGNPKVDANGNPVYKVVKETVPVATVPDATVPDATEGGSKPVDVDKDGNPTNPLDNKIETPIVEAEQIKKAGDDAIDQAGKDAGELVNDAIEDLKTNVGNAEAAAKEAEAAAKEAEDALEDVKNANSYSEAEAAASMAQDAADLAQVAADKAKGEWEAAKDRLDKANEDLDNVIKELNKLLDGEAANSETGTLETEGINDKLAQKKVEAQNEIDDAEKIVEKAEKALNEATESKNKAEDYAKTAIDYAATAASEAEKADGASENIDKEVRQPVLDEIEALKVDEKEQAAKVETDKLLEIKDPKSDVSREIAKQDSIIEEQEIIYNDAEKVKKGYDEKIDDFDYDPWGPLGLSKKEKAEKARDAGKGHYEYRMFRKIWVDTTEEYDAACEALKNYTSWKQEQKNAQGKMNEASKEIEKAKANKAKEQEIIDEAARRAAEADNNYSAACNRKTTLETYLASFAYKGDMEDEEAEKLYKKLKDEMDASSRTYNDIFNDVETYEWATDRILDVINPYFIFSEEWYEWNEKAGIETGIEKKYHEFKTKDGTRIVFYSDGKNKERLIVIRKEKAYPLDMDEKEYASFAAAFAAAKAAEAEQKAAESAIKAAKAAQAELDAKTRLDAARAALETAKNRLNGISIKEAEFENYKAGLKAAQELVIGAEDQYDKAQEAADDAQRDADNAKREAEKLKPIPTPGVVDPTLDDPSAPGETTTGGTTIATTTVTLPVATAGADMASLMALYAAGAGVTAPTAAGGVAVAGDDGDLTVIGDAAAPLAEAPEEKLTEEPTTEPTKKDDKKDIEDNKTPLAAPADQNGFNWWWLLLLLAAVVAGGTYAYNENKKRKTAQAGTQEVKEDNK